MALVDLSMSISVDPAQVASIEIVGSHDRQVLVTMQDGRSYAINPNYRESIWDAKARLGALISKASKPEISVNVDAGAGHAEIKKMVDEAISQGFADFYKRERRDLR